MDPLDALETTRRKTGHRWADFIVGGSAIVIAVISLVVALRQSVIMKEQLAASVWPYLQFETSNGNEAGEHVISYDLENVGVGPARIRWLTLLYDDQPLADLDALLEACCKDLVPEGRPRFSVNTMNDSVLAPNRPAHLFLLRNVPENARYWERLNLSTPKINLQLCYCSVLDECWMSDAKRATREPVARCPVPPTPEFRP